MVGSSAQQFVSPSPCNLKVYLNVSLEDMERSSCAQPCRWEDTHQLLCPLLYLIHIWYTVVRCSTQWIWFDMGGANHRRFEIRDFAFERIPVLSCPMPPRGAAIFFEFKHYKPKKKKISTRRDKLFFVSISFSVSAQICWCFLSMVEISWRMVPFGNLCLLALDFDTGSNWNRVKKKQLNVINII